MITMISMTGSLSLLWRFKSIQRWTCVYIFLLIYNMHSMLIAILAANILLVLPIETSWKYTMPEQYSTFQSIFQSMYINITYICGVGFSRSGPQACMCVYACRAESILGFFIQVIFNKHWIRILAKCICKISLCVQAQILWTPNCSACDFS